MASGKIHGRATATISPLSFAVSYLYTNDLIIGIMSFLGCLFGLFMEPDLDVDILTMSERRLLKVTPIGILWVLIWTPYARLIPHRHPISHFPIISTIIRYFYLFLFIFIPTIGIGFFFGQPFWFLDLIRMNQVYIFWFFVGTTLSDIGHWIFDLKL